MARTDVNDLLSKALESPEFRSAFAHVAKEKATRPVRLCHCVVLEIPQMARPDQYAHITPGTVTAFVAREGEPLLHRLAEALKANASKEFDSITKTILALGDQASREITAAAPRTEPRSRAFPSFVEVSYAHKTLVSCVHVDDFLRIQAYAFPYNGGTLERKHFSMLEYYHAGYDTPMSCVLIIRQPMLSDIERDALRLVPSASSANNVAPAPIDPCTPALLAFLVIATEAAARWLYNEFVNWFVGILHGTTALAALPDDLLESEELQNKLRTLQEATAAELLRLRAEILLKGSSE